MVVRVMVKCDICGHRVSKWDTICSHCGKPLNSGSFYDPYNPGQLLQNGSDIQFTFIGPEEKVMGEFKPSSKVKSYLTKQRIKATALQFIILFIPGGSALTLPGNFDTTTLYLPLLTYMAFVITFSVLPTYVYLKRLSRTVYIITDKRIIFTKPKGKAVSKSIPVESIEAAIAVSYPSTGLNYYSVFFPKKGYFDMEGIDTNLPVSKSLLIRIEKKDEKNYHAKPKVRHVLKSARRILKEIRERSFLYLDEIDSLKAVKLFNNMRLNQSPNSTEQMVP